MPAKELIFDAEACRQLKAGIDGTPSIQRIHAGNLGRIPRERLRAMPSGTWMSAEYQVLVTRRSTNDKDHAAYCTSSI